MNYKSLPVHKKYFSIFIENLKMCFPDITYMLNSSPIVWCLKGAVVGLSTSGVIRYMYCIRYMYYMLDLDYIMICIVCNIMTWLYNTLQTSKRGRKVISCKKILFENEFQSTLEIRDNLYFFQYCVNRSKMSLQHKKLIDYYTSIPFILIFFRITSVYIPTARYQ